MSCCGNRQHRPPVAAGRTANLPVTFEFSGHNSLTIFGRATGTRYHFPGPGARVRVDPRDAPILEIVRGLRIVGKTPEAP
jgi:hypothetical protein